MRPRAFPLTPTVRGRDTLLEFTVPPFAYGDSIDIDILFNFFLLSLSLSLSIVVRFSARSLSGFRIDFSCGGFWQPRENEKEGRGART